MCTKLLKGWDLLGLHILCFCPCYYLCPLHKFLVNLQTKHSLLWETFPENLGQSCSWCPQEVVTCWHSSYSFSCTYTLWTPVIMSTFTLTEFPVGRDYGFITDISIAGNNTWKTILWSRCHCFSLIHYECCVNVLEITQSESWVRFVELDDERMKF